LLVGLVFNVLVIIIAWLTQQLGAIDLHLASVGVLITGIIAHDMGRQKPGRTILGILATTAIVAAFAIMYLALLDLMNVPISPPDPLPDNLGYPPEWRLLAIAISVLVAMLLFKSFVVRAGGFISGAYIALFVQHWQDLLYMMVVAVLTWVVVAKIIMPRMMIFGRRKLSSMVLFGALIGWTGIAILNATVGFNPGSAFPIMAMIVPALIANDTQRQGWLWSVLGLAMSGAAVLGVMRLTMWATALLGWR
jgi:hypothetical protein